MQTCNGKGEAAQDFLAALQTCVPVVGLEIPLSLYGVAMERNCAAIIDGMQTKLDDPEVEDFTIPINELIDFLNDEY